MLNTLKGIITNTSSNTSLRTVLIIPFVLQIVGTVGLVGYLSWRSGEKAVENLAGQLVEEVSDRVNQNLQNYINVPQQINQNNAAAIRLGIVNWKDFSTLEKYFAQQLQIYPEVSSVALATEQKEALFVERLLNSNSLVIRVLDASTNYKFHSYTADRQGKREKLKNVRSDYNPHNDPPNGRSWYQAVKQAKRPIWMQVVTLSQGVKNPLLLIANLLPFYDKDGGFQGVVASTVYLPQLDSFLHGLKVGQTGQSFIIDRKGFLISSSTGEAPFKQNLDANYLQNLNPQDWKLEAKNSRNALTQASMNSLLSHLGNLSQITKKKRCDFQIGNARQFLQVTPITKKSGLDYLVIVVIPEADFTQEIEANTRTTILLCILALITATAIGIITARWITKPILRLNAAAKNVAKGEWDQIIQIKRSDEIGELANSFNKMAEQLQASFREIKDKENRLNQFLEALPVGVTIYNSTGQVTYINLSAKQLLDIETLSDAKTKQLSKAHQVYLSGTAQLYPVEEMPIVKALLGESNTADNLELHWGERIIPVEVRATPIYDETGKIVYAIAVFTDITERKEAQKILTDYNEVLEHEVIRRTSKLIQLNQQLEYEITERQRVETEIIQSKDLLESIFNESTDAIFLVAPETLLIIDCNRRAVELFEAQSKNELLHTQGHLLQKESFTPEELHSIADNISLNCFNSFDLEYVTKKGKIFWGKLAAKKIQVAGQTINLVHVKDITERKKAELQLQESKHFIERIANASPNLWYIYDHFEQRNIYSNRELATVLGYTQQEMQTMGSALLQTIIHPEDFARFPAHLKLWETATDNDIFEIDYRVRNAQGKWRTLLTLETVFERTTDGVVKQVIGTSTDITERKCIEETLREKVLREKAITEKLKRTQAQLIQAEKMSSLGQMIAGIAHEINNPVGFIYGNLTPARQYHQDLLSLLEAYQQTYPNPTPQIQRLTEEIELDFLIEDWSKLMDSMQVGAERISEIVRSLRNFSRLDEKELKAVDVHEGIDNTLLILQHRLKAQGSISEIQVIKDYGKLPLVTCYANQLNQVFMNLLTNAIDALKNQSSLRIITIRTSLTTGKEPQTNSVIIRITDNGCGINEKVKNQIFDPFFTTKPIGSGTGLGLAVSYQIIVDKHQGKIHYISDLGQGTNFIVEIPVKPRCSETN
ncbi:MAG: PAS domain S-box protein [Coleofasciculaceae cyanobacterium]